MPDPVTDSAALTDGVLTQATLPDGVLTARFLSRPPHCEPAARPLPGRRPAASGHVPAAEVCAARAPRPVRPGRPTVGAASPDCSETVTEARTFADRTLRMILEVLDRRRKPEHLRQVLDAGLVDTVAALSRSDLPARRLGAAVLTRVHVSMVQAPTLGITAPGTAAAETFATYARGERVFAIAARMERRTAGWRCAALRIV